MISVVDYGAGNLRSVLNALSEIKANYALTTDGHGLRAASKIILPGVGHFGQMMRSIDAMNVRGALLERIAAGVPFLGICLGLQALFNSSDEAPEVEGLGLLAGTIRRFDGGARVPHMGWNTVESRGPSRLLANMRLPMNLYFAHSYYAPIVDATVATCSYTVSYTAILEQRNVFGVQFHPEKSGSLGLQIMKNFVDL